MESPRTIDKYELVEKLGEGGFGVVYKARHLVTKLHVAIKILVVRGDAHPEVETRFRREAFIGNEIDHDNIVRAIDFGDTGGQPYLVLEFLDGMGLDEAVRVYGPLLPHRAARITLQVADALAAAHAHGVIHRDLKPENIFLIRRNGRDDFVKVLDFGIAKLTAGASVDGLATRSQMLIGSPVTMSPEQCRGADIDARSDVYALGVVLFYALTGRYPFFGAQADILSMHLRDRPPRVDDLRPGVPDALVAIVARALAKDPAERFQSMNELARELAPLTGDPALAATPPAERATVPLGSKRAARTPAPSRARWPAMVAVAVAGALVALAGAGAWRWAQTARTNGTATASGAMTSETTRAATNEAARSVATTAEADRATATGKPTAAGQAAATGKPTAAGQAAATGNSSTAGQAAASGSSSAVGQAAAIDKGSAARQAAATDNSSAAGQAAGIDKPSAAGQAAASGNSSAAGQAAATGKAAAAGEAATGKVARGDARFAPQRDDDADAHDDDPARSGTAARANVDDHTRTTEGADERRNGYLSIAVLPFAEVLVDGRVAGTTPLRNLPLKPGAHSIELINSGLHRRTHRTERIEAGVHRRIQLDWSN